MARHDMYQQFGKIVNKYFIDTVDYSNTMFGINSTTLMAILET